MSACKTDCRQQAGKSKVHVIEINQLWNDAATFIQIKIKKYKNEQSILIRAQQTNARTRCAEQEASRVAATTGVGDLPAR